MAMYNKILMALDFDKDNVQIIAKGKQIAEENGANLYLIHVEEPIAVAYAVDGFSANEQIISLQTSIRQEAQQRLAKLGADLSVPADRQLLREGNPSAEIHAAVAEIGADLIVIGTHGQRGLQLLLGSTASSVLHGVSCDVLTVRIKA